jgi:hypothetical protein
LQSFYPDKSVIIHRPISGDGLAILDGRASFIIDVKGEKMNSKAIWNEFKFMSEKSYCQGQEAASIEILVDATGSSYETSILVSSECQKIGIPVVIVHCQESQFMLAISHAAELSLKNETPTIEQIWKEYLAHPNDFSVDSVPDFSRSMSSLANFLEGADKGFEEID